MRPLPRRSRRAGAPPSGTPDGRGTRSGCSACSSPHRQPLHAEQIALPAERPCRRRDVQAPPRPLLTLMPTAHLPAATPHRVALDLVAQRDECRDGLQPRALAGPDEPRLQQLALRVFVGQGNQCQPQLPDRVVHRCLLWLDSDRQGCPRKGRIARDPSRAPSYWSTPISASSDQIIASTAAGSHSAPATSRPVSSSSRLTHTRSSAPSYRSTMPSHASVENRTPRTSPSVAVYRLTLSSVACSPANASSISRYTSRASRSAATSFAMSATASSDHHTSFSHSSQFSSGWSIFTARKSGRISRTYPVIPAFAMKCGNRSTSEMRRTRVPSVSPCA